MRRNIIKTPLTLRMHNVFGYKTATGKVHSDPISLWRSSHRASCDGQMVWRQREGDLMQNSLEPNSPSCLRHPSRYWSDYKMTFSQQTGGEKKREKERHKVHNVHDTVWHIFFSIALVCLSNGPIYHLQPVTDLLNQNTPLIHQSKGDWLTV